jgi:hypothetical protein
MLTVKILKIACLIFVFSFVVKEWAFTTLTGIHFFQTPQQEPLTILIPFLTLKCTHTTNNHSALKSLQT